MNPDKNKVTALLGSKFLAEALSVASLLAAFVALKIYPVSAIFGIALSVMAFIPLATYGRQRYCITGFFIFWFSAVGLLGSIIAILMHLANYARG